MSFKQAIATCFSKYATFSGRAARSEFWFWALFTWLTSLTLGVLEYLIFFSEDFQPLSALFSLAVLLPSIAVAARRLHDIDKSGWWQLLMLIPLIGLIVLIIWYTRKGSDGENRFGEDPLNPTAGLVQAF